MAAAIKQAVGIDAELIPSGGGVFDVAVDGRVVYSKQETGRFPGDEEILAQLPTES